MLAEVSRAVKKQKFVTFLGWTPHPMNVQLKMHYLKGGEKYFGDTGSVYTLTRKGYAQACPNVGKLLTNLSFTQEMENSIMAEVVNKKVSNAEAAKAWIKANPGGAGQVAGRGEDRGRQGRVAGRESQAVTCRPPQ